jgi:hypothetical protein
MDLKKYLALMAVVSFVAVGCGSKEDDLGSSGGGGGNTSASAAKMGTASITGKVTLSGAAPSASNISMDADPVCKSQHTAPVKDDSVVVGKGGSLQNVFVYVKDGAGNYPAPSAAVTLIQKGCMYSPHVFGIQVNQPLEIVNEDPTLHNVHAMAVTNDAFNVGQPTQGMSTEKKFSKAEVPLRFKCDVHGWMHCVAGVMTNPFFSVSGSDGSFNIGQLPAGSYTLVAFQEKYGESAPQKIDIKDGEAKTVNFTFAAQ